MKIGKRKKRETGKKPGMSGAAVKPPAGDEKAVKTPEAKRELVKRGYAREGDLIATVEPAVFGKEGKNVLGEPIPAQEVNNPRLIAGLNVSVEKATHYFSRITGCVEVHKDEKGSFYIKSKQFKNGKFTVSVSEDVMSANLSLTPPVGDGRAVTVDDITEECSRLGITHGINRDVINETVEKAVAGRDTVLEATIAQGEQPENGEDGEIKFHVIWASGSVVRQRDDGSTDFKNQDRVTSVRKDQLVAILKKETIGKRDGTTVRGQSYKAQSGRPVEIELGDNVRAEDRGDTVEYYSGINGQLLTDGKRLTVDPVLVIEGEVGPKTGNVRFSGAVTVTGSIQDTFNVFASKDIIVKGNVGNSIVKTRKNLTVGGGIVGKKRGFVQVGGDVSVKFAENSKVFAGGSIEIQRAALNCDLIAGSRIVATKEKGQIIGGEIRAKDGIEVKVLGNESEHRMEVHVGTDFFVELEVEEIRAKMRKYEQALRKAIQLLEKLKKVNPDPEKLPDNLKKVYGDIRKKGAVAKLAINELKKKEASRLPELEELHEADVKVTEALYRGVKIFFGKSVYEPESTEMNVRITFDREKNKIEVENLDQSR